jgi:hypothetical protein
MLRDQRPEISRSGKVRQVFWFVLHALDWLPLSLEELYMHEYRRSKEQALGRTLHKTLRLMKKCLLLGLMAKISLAAQHSAPSVTTWTGVVRTVAGRPVAKAKVTLFIPTAKENQLTAVTGADGKFAIARIPPGLHNVSVQLPGRGPTAPVAVDITDVTIVLTVSGQNVLSTAANPQTPPAELSNASSSGTTNTASETSGEKLSSQKVNELPLNGRDFSTLLLLAAGTMTDVNGQTNFTQQFAINGQRGVEAVFAMDGSRHRARRGRLYQYRDTVREERISRFLLRVSKELCPRCAELFRSPVDCRAWPNPSFPQK